MNSALQFIFVIAFFGLFSNAASRAVGRIDRANQEGLAEEGRYARTLAALLVVFWMVALANLVDFLNEGFRVGYLFFWFCIGGGPGIFMTQSILGVYQSLRRKKPKESGNQ